MLLGAYNDVELWKRLILNRTGFALGARSRIIQELLILTARYQTQPGILVGFLNSADWARGLSRELPDEALLVDAHIRKLLEAVADQLKRREAAESAGPFNRQMAARLRAAVANFPPARAEIEKIFGHAVKVITAALTAHPAMRLRKGAALETVNYFQQVALPLPSHIPGPVVLPIIWFEALYCHSEYAAKKLRWHAASEVSNFEAFRDNPSLSQILRLSLIAKGLPRREAEGAIQDKTGESSATSLLRALLYSEKTSESERGAWWREACLNRLGSVLAPHGAFCEQLLAILNDRDDGTLDQLFQLMNSTGKGNAEAWLKEFQGKTGEYRAKAAAGLEDALDHFAGQLKKIAEPDEAVKDQVSLANSLAAKRIRERLAKLPKAADATANALQKADGALNTILTAPSAIPLQRAVEQAMNEVVQKEAKLPDRPGPELPDIGWIELLYLYADGTPVKDAKYSLNWGAERCPR